jgi:phosphoribosylcarboxyaminoimidazole (NCAIR) mutase
LLFPVPPSQVIIAGAGGAAHLPGMVAALTPLPVIGVPVKSSTMSGLDSLYSIVQMPKGVPVATVAIGESVGGGFAIHAHVHHQHTHACATTALSGLRRRFMLIALVGFCVCVCLSGNAANAGLLAVRILAANQHDLLSKMSDFMVTQETEVLGKAEKLETIGFKEYLASK